MNKARFIAILLFLAFCFIYAVFFIARPNEFDENDLYDEIQNRGYIKVGINVDSKPFGFYDQNGNLQGYDVDLAHYIAQYILKNTEAVKFIPVTPSNRLLKASTGEVDIVISTVTITPQRMEVVDFSIPYDNAGQAILVKKNSQIKSLADLSGQNVGVIFGTTAEKNIKALSPTANVLGFKSYEDAYKALKTGYISAITSDDTILNRYVVEDATIQILPKRYSKEPYGIAFKKGKTSEKFKQNINYTVRELLDTGKILRLRKKWNVL